MASTQIPNDLLAMDLSTKQLLEIMDIRSQKKRLANRLIAWPARERDIKDQIVQLQKTEDELTGKGDG